MERTVTRERVLTNYKVLVIFRAYALAKTQRTEYKYRKNGVPK